MTNNTIEDYIMALKKTEFEDISASQRPTPRAISTSVFALVVSLAATIYVFVYGVQPPDMSQYSSYLIFAIPIIIGGLNMLAAYWSPSDPRLDRAMTLVRSFLYELETNSQDQDQESPVVGD